MSACIGGGGRALAQERHNLGATQLNPTSAPPAARRPPLQRHAAFEVEGSIDLHRAAEW